MKIGHIDVEVRQGDWTHCASDGAVVNPSNTALIHGAGLAHAIDVAGGPEYMRDLERIRSRHVSSVKLPVGQAEYTDTTKYSQGYVIVRTMCSCVYLCFFTSTVGNGFACVFLQVLWATALHVVCLRI